MLDNLINTYGILWMNFEILFLFNFFQNFSLISLHLNTKLGKKIKKIKKEFIYKSFYNTLSMGHDTIFH